MSRALLRRLIPLAVLLVVMVFLMPRDAKFPYDYRVGKEWAYESLYAQFDFPILKSDNQLREERIYATPDLVPYFQYSEEETGRILKAIDNLELGELRRSVLVEVRDIYKKGVLVDETRSNKGDIPDSDVIYIIKDKQATKYPQEEVYRQTSAKNALISALSLKSDINVDSLLRFSGLYNYIVPNLFYDEHTTRLVQEESIKDISPTSGYINTGQLIVSEGEMVTSEIAQTLNSYKSEFESNVGYLRSPIMLISGNFIILLAILALLFFTINICSPKENKDNRIYLVVDLYALFACLTLLMERLGGDYILLVPFTLLVFFYRSFFEVKESLLFYAISLLPLLICSKNGIALYIIFLVAGLESLLTYNSYQKTWKQIIRVLFTFVVLTVLLLAFRASDMLVGNVWSQLALLLLNSLLIVAGLPSLSLLEKIYNLVSDSRLVELGDTSSEVMRVMEQKAPGSFQHSIQVMNMAETVARAVDVNPELVRVGALYHDLGKIKNPLCFVENESLLLSDEAQKYHEQLGPEQSAKDIIHHIEDGLEVASDYHLPKLVKDFIITHHGTTCVRYFYDKFLKDGGEPSRRGEFCYKGQKPQTKAQLILMLCDSIEAASRTIKAKTPEAYSTFVENIVASKMEEGQLDEVNITFADLHIIKETIKNYLAQLNHNRVAYPKK